MAISLVQNRNNFTGHRNELAWDQRSNAGSPLGEGSAVRTTDRNLGMFAIGNPLGAIEINRTGRQAHVTINNPGIDVSLDNGEPCIKAQYPTGRTMPDNTPIVLDFSAPVSAVGTFVSILGDNSLYNDRDILGIMWFQLVGDTTTWRLAASQGRVNRFATGTVTSPFVGAQSDAAKIKKVWFDASIAGNFDSIVISRLYWVA